MRKELLYPGSRHLQEHMFVARLIPDPQRRSVWECWGHMRTARGEQVPKALAPYCSCKEAGFLCSFRLQGALDSGWWYWLERTEAAMEPLGPHAPQVLESRGYHSPWPKPRRNKGDGCCPLSASLYVTHLARGSHRWLACLPGSPASWRLFRLTRLSTLVIISMCQPRVPPTSDCCALESLEHHARTAPTHLSPVSRQIWQLSTWGGEPEAGANPDSVALEDHNAILCLSLPICK